MMDIDITEREDNELLNRESITLTVSHGGEATPSEQAVRDAVAAELDLDPATIRVDGIHSSRGSTVSDARLTVFEEPVIDPEELEADDEDTADEDAEADESEEDDAAEADDAEADAEEDEAADEATDDAEEETEDADDEEREE